MSLAYLASEGPYIANTFLAGGVNEIIRNQVPFVGLDESEVKTGSIGTALLGLQYNMFKNTYLTARVNAALYNFHDLAFDEITAKNNLLSGYGLSFGLNSPLGPIELTGMYCDQDGKVRTNISLGFSF
jgi:NTE family protein